jgi:hypothetical protein
MRLPALSPVERVVALSLLLTLPLARPLLRGEGNGHYAWVASLVVDRDLDATNQYRRGDPDFVAGTFRRADGRLWPTMETPGGRARNQFSVGPALLWLPAFAQAHAATLLASDLGVDLAPDGYSWPYLWACALTTASLAVGALLLALRLAAPLTSPPAAALAALGIAFASSLPVYAYALPFYAHAPAAFALALFLWLWRWPAPFDLRRWVVWGASGGLLILVDPVGTSFLLVAAVEWLRQLRVTRDAAGGLTAAAAFASAALVAISPQLAANAIVHGSPLDSGWFHRFFWDEPRLLAHALGAEHGVFLWTPVTLVALAGLARLALRLDRYLGCTLLAASILYYYVVASGEGWHAAPGFGNRFLVPLTPVWVVGLAAAIEALERSLASLLPARRWRWAGIAGALGLATLWNLGLVFQWGTGLVPRREAVDFRLVARQQFTAVPQRLVSLARRVFARGAGG